MTMTESPPTTASASAPSPAVAGLYDALTTTDHKTIGRLWLRAGVILLVAAAVVGVVVGAENADPASVDIFGGDNNFFQWWSLHRFGLALLVAAPLFVGLATIVVPMQVGATNIAFPRAALAAAWSFLVGAGITVVAVAAGGGWGALDGVTGAEADAIALTLVGTGMVIASILLASVCIATTVVSLRVPGMNLMRVPLFAWSMLVAASVWLLTLPVALANLVIVYVDLRGGPLLFGDPQSTMIHEQFAWVVEQPQVYAFAIPALGILGSIVPVAAGARHAQHSIAMALVGLFGLLSVGGWSQPFFHDNTEQFVFIVFGIAAVLPVLGSMGGAAVTLMRGESTFAGLPPVHLIAALASAVLLLTATVAGLARVIEPFELGGRSTSTGVLILAGFAAVTAAVGGMWFWAPKIGGRELSPGLGRLVVLELVGGALLFGGAEVINGFFDAPQLQLAASDDDIVDILNVVGMIGAILIALGALGVLAALAAAMRGGPAAADNPWGGHTLEWATPSPPPAGNFDEPPAKVGSEAPLLDEPGDDAGDGGAEALAGSDAGDGGAEALAGSDAGGVGESKEN